MCFILVVILRWKHRLICWTFDAHFNQYFPFYVHKNTINPIPASRYWSWYDFMLHWKRISVLWLIPTLLKPLSFDPEAWLCEITIKLLSACYLGFFSCREIKGRSSPSPPHLDHISGRFLVDQRRGHLRIMVTPRCLLLSVSVRPLVTLGKAAEVTDEQHLIPTDHYIWVSFPICVPVCDESSRQWVRVPI